MALGRSSDLSVDISGDAAGLERALKSADAALVRSQRAALNYDSSLSKLGGDIARLEKQIEDDLAQALDRQHAAMEKTGRGMLVFGAAVAAGLALAGREAMNWESAWAGVTKTVDGSEQELADLEGQLRSLATTLPSTHTEIAAVAEAAGQLGVARGDITAFTRTMIDLGETTNLSADAAATSIAQFMNVMKSESDTVDEIGSTLVALGNAGASTEAEIMSLAQRLSGAGALLGATEAEVLALSSAMADLGIESNLGGGAASRVLLKMYEHVKNGGPKLEQLGQIAGMTGQQFATAFGEEPLQAFDQFIQGLGRIRDGGGNVIKALSDIKVTGTQNLSVMLRLAGAGDRLTTSLERADAAWKANNALQEEAAKRYATTEAQAAIAMNAVRDNAIDIGATVLPIFASIADTVANLATAFGSVPGPVKTAMVIFASLAAAVALTGGAFLIAVPKIHAFNTALDGMQAGALKSAGTRVAALGSMLTGPLGIALAGATIAVGVYAAKQGEAARVADALRSTLDEQTGAITDNSEEWARNELVQSGALAAAKRLGLDLGDVTDAALGNAAAHERVNAALEVLTTGYSGTMGKGFGDMSKAEREAAKDARNLARELGLLQDAVETGTTEWQLNAEAAGDAGAATRDTASNFNYLEVNANAAAEAQEATTAAWEAGEGAAADLGEEVKTLGEDLETLAGSFLSNRDAQRAVREQLRGVKDRLKDLREEYGPLRDENGKLRESFKRGTAGGDALAETLDGISASMYEQLEAAEKNGAGEKRMMALWEQSRDQLRAVAEQLGMTKEQAAAYTREVLGTPKMVRTRFQQQGVEEALTSIRGLRDAALEASGTYDLTFQYLKTGREPARFTGVNGARAMGGPVEADKAYAVGETGYEVFVPGADGYVIPNHDLGPLSGRDVREGAGAHGTAATQIDYPRLARALEASRPLYGDVHVQPHNYGQFRREMDEDRRRAASDGIR